jgi:sec-independent protein translocase protein TatA
MGLENPLHIAIILLVVLMVFGAKRLPEMGRSLGEGLRGFKESISGDHAHTDPAALEAPAAPVPPVALAPAPSVVPAPAPVPSVVPAATSGVSPETHEESAPLQPVA